MGGLLYIWSDMRDLPCWEEPYNGGTTVFQTFTNHHHTENI
jgi:hypothetical protein